MRLFSRKPHIPSTGHPGDDQLLATIAARSDLTSPRHWVHYLYFPDEASARKAAESIAASGWKLQYVERAATDDGQWIVVPERHDVVVSPALVEETRVYFEAVAARVPGAEYDGWEASL